MAATNRLALIAGEDDKKSQFLLPTGGGFGTQATLDNNSTL